VLFRLTSPRRGGSGVVDHGGLNPKYDSTKLFFMPPKGDPLRESRVRGCRL
jgi:hypothetical protein